MRSISPDFRNLLERGAAGNLPDGRLLERFLSHRDGGAFETLVERHGPMVWSVCRRMLVDHHEAEDAFQATFLVLARRAASIAASRESIGGWLYGVARRTSAKARAKAARRRAMERPTSDDQPEAAADDRESRREEAAMLDQELDRLPGRYRIAIVLCELEGLTRGEAARRLGWPEGTVASRLARGRKLLLSRLARRGLAPSAAGLAAIAHGEAPAAPSRNLIAAAARGARRIADDALSPASVSSPSAALVREVVAGMLLKKAAVGATLVMLVLAGAGLGYRATASDPRGAGEEPQAAPRSTDPGERIAAAARLRGEARSALEKTLAVVGAIDDLEQRVWILCEIARLQSRTGLAADVEATLKAAVEAARETESEHRIVDVAEALARAGDVRKAVELVNPLPFNRGYGLDHVASAMAGNGDFAGALRVAEAIENAIENESYKREAFRAIAVARVESGDVDGAFATVARIADDEARAWVLAAVAARQHRANDPAAAASLERLRIAADEMIRGANEKGDPAAPVALLARIAEVLAEAGSIDDARKVAGAIVDATWREVARMSIATAQAGRGEIEAALKTAAEIQSAYRKGEALKDVVAAQVAAGDLVAAGALAERIEPGFWRVEALLAIAQGDYRSGRRGVAMEHFEAARRQAEPLTDGPLAGNVMPAAFGRIARAEAELGEEKAALAWIDARTSPLDKAWSLLGLAEGLAGRLPAPPPRAIPAADGDALESLARPITKTSAAASDLKPITSLRGKIMLFGTMRPGDRAGRRIERINADGTGLETVLILDEGESIHTGRISADGERLAFSASQPGKETPDLWLLTTNRVRRKLADDLLVVAWSPDGRRIAAIRDTDPKTPGRENLILDVETGRERKLPIPEADAVEDWSPDGKTLALMAGNVDKVFEHPTKGAYPLRWIDLMNPDGTGRAPLTTRPMADNLDARFSPDGTRVTYFQRRYHDNLVLHFAVVQGRDGSGARDLAQFDEVYKGDSERRPNGAPCWSPDGKAVVWFVPRRKLQSSTIRCELLILDVETGRATRLDLHQRGLEWVQAVDWR